MDTKADLLIVGGTESGCAAALQAARMGVKSIVLVNDIDWLGGQFSAEALAAIDENRGPEGYGHGVPFPRSGIFREVIDEIETLNTQKFSVPRPGNTRVITTCLPEDAEHVFRKLLKPFVDRGEIKIYSNYAPIKVMKDASGQAVNGVIFESTMDAERQLQVQAALTIDASDWGDVIRLSGAEFEFGPDLKSKYNEPLAPTSREEYPLTDMNPITYCMVMKETDTDQTIPEPKGFDRRDYDGLSYPSDPSWIYESRRIIDRHHFPSVTTPEAVLLCFPAFDYPLDQFTQSVVDALEATEKGASQRNIVEMTRAQRQIVFDDAKQRSLGFLYYLQTIAHEKASDPKRTFRNLQLSNAFGTSDRLPPKPYVRESLRLKSLYQLRQQDTMGVGDDARNYATAMFHDPIACWQFEYDFHPTKRKFLDDNPAGPWHPTFRKNRTWGPPYSGRAQFSLRSLVPEKIDGLLGAQKNLGYSSIVSSAVRLHDQSIAIGQGCGAVAAVALREKVKPRELTWRIKQLAAIWTGLLEESKVPQTLWPFGDLDPKHADFISINQLAVRQLFPLAPNEFEFHADDVAHSEWQKRVITKVHELGVTLPGFGPEQMTRGEFAARVWNEIKNQIDLPIERLQADDADADGILDLDDPLPLSEGRRTWGDWCPPPEQDGLPDPALVNNEAAFRINFSAEKFQVDNFVTDSGKLFDAELRYGWKRSIAENHRQRGRYVEMVRDTFLFTRTHDIWEYELAPGSYKATVCVGDSGHEQVGQNVTVEGLPAIRDLDTPSGQFFEMTMEVEVSDGRLTLEIGRPDTTTNTCLNWAIIEPVDVNR